MSSDLADAAIIALCCVFLAGLTAYMAFLIALVTELIYQATKG